MQRLVCCEELLLYDLLILVPGTVKHRLQGTQPSRSPSIIDHHAAAQVPDNARRIRAAKSAFSCEICSDIGVSHGSRGSGVKRVGGFSVKRVAIHRFGFKLTVRHGNPIKGCFRKAELIQADVAISKVGHNNENRIHYQYFAVDRGSRLEL